MNGIYNGVFAEEFRRISTCKTTKKAWDVLQIVYEGTSIVKQSKLQRLTKELETIVMEEDETFDQFYPKLNDMATFIFNLSEEIPETRLLRGL